MGSDLKVPFAIDPMVEEHEATGGVAAVYGQILESVTFVPSLFKSLAPCPGYLVLAWDQASHALAEPTFRDAAATPPRRPPPAPGGTPGRGASAAGLRRAGLRW